MPFKSEKQRKYLWANEPAIARDWTDKYGSRVKKQEGGILEYLQNMNLGDVGLYGGTALGALGAGAGWQSMQDINAINRMAASGNYGVGNPMPQAFMDKLKGAYTPSSVFKKTGYPTGLGKWFFNTSSPGHFKPVQTAMQVGKHLGSWGGQAVSGLPLAYTYGASKLQESLPMSLIGQGGLSDQNPYFGAMGVSVDPTVEETLRYGDDGKPSPDTGEGSTLAGIWNAIKNEFGGSAEAAEMPNQTNYDYEGNFRGSNHPDWWGKREFNPEKYKSMTDEINRRNAAFHEQSLARLNKDEDDPYIDPRRIPGRIQKSVPRNRGMLERFRNRFYKPATSAAGGYNVSQLNKMNALGGYYSEPVRQQRRTEARRTNILNRAAKGKAVGNVNQLLGKYGYTGTPGSGTLQFTGQHEGSSTAGAGYSRSDDSWSSSPFRRGGLASLWQR